MSDHTLPENSALNLNNSTHNSLTPELLSRLRVVLVEPSHPGNIGAAARAMKTMGVHDLWLVSPHRFPDAEATARASGADDVLLAARVVSRLEDALAGVTLAAALTSRRRELSLPVQTSRAAATSLLQRSATGESVALVFGNETYGLSNVDVSLCQFPVTIPTNPAYASLNLGAAVQVMCYELRLAALEIAQEAALPPNEAEVALASVDEVEGLMAHLTRATEASGFFNPANPKRLMPRLRRLFGRLRLERDEVNILRGMLASFEAPLAHSKNRQKEEE